MKNRSIVVLLLMALIALPLQAQLFVAPHLGFKSYGLEGAATNSSGGSVSSLGIYDAGKTGFEFGATAGYTVVKGDVYSMDAALDFSFSSAGFFEAGYNSATGPGRYSADGLSGGSATILAFNILPIHRISIPNFNLLTPFGGVGLALNMYLNSDITVGPPASNPSVTVTAANNTQVGLVIFYGTTVNIGTLRPFIQFGHLIPFGSEYVFTEDPAHGSNVVMKDAPGYFSLVAGVKFDL